MTREEAIKDIEKNIKIDSNGDVVLAGKMQPKTIDTVIYALKKLNAIESNNPDSNDWEHYADRLHDIAYKSGYEQAQKDLTCEDAVSRQVVKEQMTKYGFHAPDMTVTEFVEDELPPVSPARPKGEWIKNKNTYAGAMLKNWKCTNCCDGLYDFVTTSKIKPKWNYCPNCGADMRGDNNDD